MAPWHNEAADFLALERVLGSEAGVVAANNSKNGLKSTFCPQDTPAISLR